MKEQHTIRPESRKTISIIVPVYKTERFLSACIASILAQTFTDFELILVDDGSPDGCPALCDAAAAKDSRIRVIHQKNRGLSGARNAGLDIARGRTRQRASGSPLWIQTTPSRRTSAQSFTMRRRRPVHRWPCAITGRWTKP